MKKSAGDKGRLKPARHLARRRRVAMWGPDSPRRYVECRLQRHLSDTFLQPPGAMDKVTFLDLSTRVVNDLKRWCEETTARNAITPEDLTILQGAAEIVDRITSTVVATSPE